MDTSQVVAQAVAERALGKDVTIRHLGALVEAVTPGLPAARAGVVAGDVITAVDGHPVRSAADLVRLTSALHPGDVAGYTFGSAGTKQLRTVAGGKGKGKNRAIIGVAVGDNVRIGHIPVQVHYTISGIGGPSAGLAFALEIYDSLSGRHLLDGHRIAATGELDPARRRHRDRRREAEGARRHRGRRRHLHRARSRTSPTPARRPPASCA